MQHLLEQKPSSFLQEEFVDFKQAVTPPARTEFQNSSENQPVDNHTDSVRSPRDKFVPEGLDFANSRTSATMSSPRDKFVPEGLDFANSRTSATMSSPRDKFVPEGLDFANSRTSATMSSPRDKFVPEGLDFANSRTSATMSSPRDKFVPEGLDFANSRTSATMSSPRDKFVPEGLDFANSRTSATMSSPDQWVLSESPCRYRVFAISRLTKSPVGNHTEFVPVSVVKYLLISIMFSQNLAFVSTSDSTAIGRLSTAAAA
ncbi:hypothetical protein BaRGS_00001680, partial [Batillaria attramentaria]